MASSAKKLATNSLQQPVEQVAHGLTVGKVVRLSAGSFIEAQADSELHAEVIGMVSFVSDVDHFFVTQDGLVTGLSGLVANTLYYLDPLNPGDLTTVKPTSATDTALPCFIAVSTTTGFFFGNVGRLPAVLRTGDTMTGYLILNADPVSALGAVTKQYADAIAGGFVVKDAVVASTTANRSATYNNGVAGVGATLTNNGAQVAFSTDGVTPIVGDRILVPFQAAQEENGVYEVTDTGSGATNWVLTRTTDYDTAAEIQPGTFIPVVGGTTYMQTSWIETATVTVVGTDPIVFAQFTASPNTFATVALSNLSSVAINTTLLPNADNTIDLGATILRWQSLYAAELKTGETIGDTIILSGRDVDGVSDTPFFTITAGNTPTAVLSGSVTGTTQAPGTNTTQLATTAFTAALGALKANVSLDNLAGVAINTTLVSDTDITDDLGTQAIRWRNIYAQTLQTGDTAGDTLSIGAWDVDGTSLTTFILLTANNTPTCSLASAVTGVTQAVSDNSTRLSTTAYTDAQVAAIAANKALSNLTSVAINTTLVSDTDVTDNLGTQAIRWNNIYAATVQTGDTNADTLQIGAWDVDGAVFVPFFTCTAANTPTGVLASSVTATTQAPGTNTTQLATTAFVQAAVTAGSGANTALSNLAAVAINTSLVSDTDITDDLGTQAIRWRNVYTQTVQTGDTNADTLSIGAWDVDGAAFVSFFTLTAANTPTAVLASAVTATTQAPGTNTTQIATTAFVTAAVVAAGGANTALSNLAAVAINTTLLSDTDNTDDLGSATVRWKDIYSVTHRAGSGAANTLTLQARDVDGATWVDFFTLTSNNTPTAVLASSVTGTTQAASDGSTKLATTLYADTQVTTIAALKALSNLAAVAINTTLVSDTDITDDLGSGTVRWRDTYTSTVRTGTVAGNTVLFQARDVDGASWTTFATLTANNTPTFALDSAVTGVTQSANDNSTKLATTAYADAIATGGGSVGKITATGGTMTTDGAYTIHTFNSSANFVVSSISNGQYGLAQLLIIGGGGGGGGANNAGGGGGGAGGVLEIPNVMITANTYQVIVGAGGAGGVGQVVGTTGGTSYFGGIFMSAAGGGGGALGNAAANNGVAGPSGGGGTYTGVGGAAVTMTNMLAGLGYGFAGGNGSGSANRNAGGGGGAGAVGVTAVTTQSGNGGAGRANSISGASVTYAGGGGGGAYIGGTRGTGTNGGGDGGTSGNNGAAATANTGGGGGGAGAAGADKNGGAGGSGVVIIRYLTP